MPLRIALLRSMVIDGQRINARTTAALAEAVGGTDARTAGSSGNLLFRSSKSTDRLVRELEAACLDSFGRATEMVVKTEREWRALVAANPFLDESETSPDRVLVWAMRTPVPDSGIAQLQARADPRETITRVETGDFYIHFGMPNRDDSRIGRGFGLNHIGAVGTNRTWTTMRRINTVLDEM